MTNVAVEHGTVLVDYLWNMMIFHSYATLPKGIDDKSDDVQWFIYLLHPITVVGISMAM